MSTPIQNFALVRISKLKNWEPEFVEWCTREDSMWVLAEAILIDDSAVAVVDLRTGEDRIFLKSSGWLPLDIEERILHAAAKLRSEAAAGAWLQPDRARTETEGA